jgi:hypothetical protein
VTARKADGKSANLLAVLMTARNGSERSQVLRGWAPVLSCANPALGTDQRKVRC